MRIDLGDFSKGVDKSSKPTSKPPDMADDMLNSIVSTRGAIEKRKGSQLIVDTSANTEITSIFDYEKHEGGLVHMYMFTQGDKLYAFNRTHSATYPNYGVIKSGLTGGEPQYAVAGKVCYFGNGEESLKIYPIADFTLYANTQAGINGGASETLLAQSFRMDWSVDKTPATATKTIAAVSIPLIIDSASYVGETLTLSIQTDNAGSPSGTPVTNGTAQVIDMETLSDSWEWLTFTFATQPTLSNNTTYWLVLGSSGLTGAQKVWWAYDSANRYNTQWDADHPAATFDPIGKRFYSAAWNQLNPTGSFLFNVWTVDLWGHEAPSAKPNIEATIISDTVDRYPDDNDFHATNWSSPANYSIDIPLEPVPQEYIDAQGKPYSPDKVREGNAAAAFGCAAQSFVSDENFSIQSVILYLKNVGGVTSGAFTVSIYQNHDQTNLPDGSNLLGSSIPISSGAIGVNYEPFEFGFFSSIKLEASRKYWIVINNDDDYKYGAAGFESGAFNAGFSDGFANETIINAAIYWGGSTGGSPFTNDTAIEALQTGRVSSDTFKVPPFGSENTPLDELFDDPASDASVWIWGTPSATADLYFNIKASLLFQFGGRSYRYSYKNSNTGHIGPPSPASFYTGNISIANVQIKGDPSTDTQIDKVVIWATNDGGAIFYYLDEIDHVVSGSPSKWSYNDTKPDFDLVYTREAPYENYPPPDGFLIKRFNSFIAIAGVKENPRYVFYSGDSSQIFEGVQEESFPPLNFASVPSGSERIFAMDELDGQPVLFTADQIFSMSGESTRYLGVSQLRGGRSLGTMARRGSVSTEFGVFFFSADRKMYIIPTVNHIPTLLSGAIEDALEEIETKSATDASRWLLDRARVSYLNWVDSRWVMLALPESGETTNSALWIYDLDLHDAHPGQAWIGPFRWNQNEGFQSVHIITDNVFRKRIFVGTDAGNIYELSPPTASYVDAGNFFLSRYTFPLMDLGQPGYTKDGLFVEICIPASQSSPGPTFLQVAYDRDADPDQSSDWVNVTLTRVNETENSDSIRYRGYLMKRFTRIKAQINFNDEDMPGEVWGVAIEFEPLYEGSGMVSG